MMPKKFSIILVALLSCLAEWAPSQAATDAFSAASGEGCVPAGRWAVPGEGVVETAEILGRASRADIVLLAEEHDRADHHRWQLQTLAALHAVRPDMAIGFEMFPRHVQPTLDRWVAGTLTERELLAETGWSEIWGYDAALYLPLFHFARMNRIPMIALNVDRSLIAATARRGWRSVPPDERQGIGDPAPPSLPYVEALTRVYESHRAPDSRGEARDDPGLTRFIEAQLVWDRAMAEAAATAHEADDRLVVGIVGSGHARFGHGIPHQLAALGIERTVVLLAWTIGEPCENLSADLADGVFGLTPPIEPAIAPLKLGISVEPTPEGLRVTAVAPLEIADMAGLSSGDVIVAAAGERMRRPADLAAVVDRQPPGTWLPLVVRRDGTLKVLIARFPPPFPPDATPARS